MIVTVEQRELSCKLTEAQLAEISSTLAAKTMELAKLEERKKSVASDYKAKIDHMAANNNVLARKINSKSELRMVECVWQYNWTDGAKALYRMDTGEKIVEDFIKDFEMQTHFDDLKKEPEEKPAPEPEKQEPLQIEGTCEAVEEQL